MTKQETYEYLTAHGVSYEITEHKAVYNMAELGEVPLPYPEADAKNLFVRDDKKKNYYLITVKGEKRVDLKAFAAKYGTRKLSFASAEDLMALLSLIPGAVTPLGLLNAGAKAVTLFLDRDFLAEEASLIGVHPCDNTATVWLKAAELCRILRDAGITVSPVEV